MSGKLGGETRIDAPRVGVDGSDNVMIRAAGTGKGMLNKEKMTIVVLATVMLKLCAQHATGEAAGVADQRQANSSVPSESDPTGGVSYDLTRGLIGLWTFDEGKGIIAHDSSGKGNHGTIVGGAKWTKGRIGGALDFDGTDDIVLIPNESSFDITGSITVTAWIRVDSFTRRWQSIVTKGDRAWRLHRANDRSSLGWACSDLSRQEVGDLYGKTAVDDGRWHHVAGVHDGTKTCTFVDGTLDASGKSSRNISVNDYPVLIGENAQHTGRHFRGIIDDVRIYDRALSAHELQALFKGGAAAAQRPAGRTVVPQPGTRRKDVGTLDRANVARFVGASGSWPEFRGPDGQGHSNAKGVPTTWSETENIAWKTWIPGEGWSSPVISGNQIWMTSAKKMGLSLHAICVDRTSGKILYDVEVLTPSDAGPRHVQNGYASPTPVLDGKHAYVTFGPRGTVCLDTSGKIVWKNTELDFSVIQGAGSSPILYEDLLILTCDGIDVQYIAALDKHTGKVRWKQDRQHLERVTRTIGKMAYSTPLAKVIDGVPQLVSSGADHVCAYDLRTGKEIWWMPYTGFSQVGRPSYGNGLFYVIGSISQDHFAIYAVRPGKGKLSDDQVVWMNSSGIGHVPSPLLVGKEIYAVHDNGITSCIDAMTGKLHWKKRLGGNYRASPIEINGKIYTCSREGVCHVLATGKKYKVVATNKLDGILMASPAVAGGALFIRSNTHLYRIETPGR